MNNIQENDLVKKYMGIARSVAMSYSMVTPENVLFDDLFSVGLIAVWDAVKSGKSEHIKARVVWSIKDELRRHDFVDKHKRKKINVISEIRDRLFTKLGRYPEDIEIAEESGMSLDEYNKFVFLCQDSRLYENIDDIVYDDEQLFDGIFAREVINRADLNHRELKILKLLYVDGYTLAEVGKKIGVIESRVCQIRKDILSKMMHAIDDETKIA